MTAQRPPLHEHFVSWRTKKLHFTCQCSQKHFFVSNFCAKISKFKVTEYLEDCVKSVDHVPELFFLSRSQSAIIISSDQLLHFASLKVGNLEGVSQTLLEIDQARPVKQVNQTGIKTLLFWRSLVIVTLDCHPPFGPRTFGHQCFHPCF